MHSETNIKFNIKFKTYVFIQVWSPFEINSGRGGLVACGDIQHFEKC
jgi:hypothetical protein